MKLNIAFEEMEVVLNELNEQFETINKNESRVPQIEIDILKASIRKLYECLRDLDKQNQLPQAERLAKNVSKLAKADVPAEPEIKAKEPVPEESQVEVIAKVAEENAISKEELTYENEEYNIIDEVDRVEESPKLKLEEPQIKIDQAVDDIPKEQNPTPSLMLSFEDENFSVNESVAKKSEDKSVVNKLSNTRIENLKSAIGINDKFYFINELFSGNSQAYEDVIYTLNNFKRFEDAMQYFSTLKFRYEWNTETEAYQKLIHFLERKFVEIHA